MLEKCFVFAGYIPYGLLSILLSTLPLVIPEYIWIVLAYGLYVFLHMINI